MATDALVSQEYSSLVNGVSLQPAHQHLTSQANAQENMRSSVANGPESRPPAEHVALMAGAIGTSIPTGGQKFHLIDRGPGQRHLVVMTKNDINVYDTTTGAEITVVDNGAAGAEASYTYLDINAGIGETAQGLFEAVTVADYTFIVNKRKVTEIDAATSAARTQAHEFLMFIKSATAEKEKNSITLEIDGTSYTSAVGSPNPITSGEIADQVMFVLTGGFTGTDITGSGGTTVDWKFTRIGENVVYGYQFQNGTDSLNISDQHGNSLYTFAGTGTSGEHPTVKSFSDLPFQGVDDFVVKVTGDEGSEEDEYYVKYVEEEKVWKEWVAPGLTDSFDVDLMPHALVWQTSTEDYTFEPLPYLDRLVGDATSAPPPSFIGNPIRDVVSHKGRLGFVSDENVILSERGELFNFWPTTVTTLIDSDPLDVAGTGDRVAIWDYALNYRSGISLFSSIGDVVGELVGSPNENLTVKNGRIEERASYAMSGIRPVAAEGSMYFLLEHGSHSTAYQYQSTDAEIFDAEEITAHVEQYLPKDIFHVAAGRAENLFCYLSDDSANLNTLTVYGFHFVGQEQAQASWSKWTFGANDRIVSAEWSESILNLVILRQDGFHMETMDFGKTEEDATLGHLVHLDSKVSLLGVYDVGTDTTTWTMPYDQATNGGTYVVVRDGAWGTQRDSQITILDASVDLSITALGDHSAHTVLIGREYEREYQLSQVFMQESGAGKSGARTGGRLQLRKGRASYSDTGTFDVEITSTEDSDTYVQTFTSQYIGQALIGDPTLDTGIFDFTIGGDSKYARISFKSSSFLPFNLTAFEWEGRFTQRSTKA
jgi:hypothetical protein